MATHALFALCRGYRSFVWALGVGVRLHGVLWWRTRGGSSAVDAPLTKVSTSGKARQSLPARLTSRARNGAPSIG